jgi:predicted glycosyltransferase involved in capsule biosynthesis
MNRTEILEQMLPSWAKIESIKDIVVVDWSSKIPIMENENIQKILKQFNKIKIVRVEDEKFFHICKSNNIGFQFTDKQNRILLKVDVDHVNIDESWIDYLALQEGRDGKLRLRNYFLIGSCRFYRGTNGFLLVNKKIFKMVKGYNENYTPGWGGEDTDLYERICNQQKKAENKHALDKTISIRVDANIPPIKRYYKVIFFNIKKYVYHIPHDEELRYCNYPPEQKFSKKNDGEWEFQKYEILSQTDNYTIIKLKNKDPICPMLNDSNPSSLINQTKKEDFPT